MKVLSTLLAAVLLVGCGSDKDSDPASAAPTEDLSFSVENLQARYELIAGGYYYFNDEKDDWKHSRGLLPLSVTAGLDLVGGGIVESETICVDKSLKTLSQNFTITVNGQTISGSSVFVISKVVALEHVYEVVKSNITL